MAGTTGSDYTANWTPWNNKADDYQFRDDLSWTKGAHQLKFGFSWAIYKKTQDAFANTEGNFRFDGSFTGNDFADYLLGYAQQYTEDAVKISGQWNNISTAAYIQDNWRVNSTLTLNLGLRWDGIPHTYEANQQSSNFYPNLYDFNNQATFDANGNICSVNSVPACAGGASPGLSSNPAILPACSSTPMASVSVARTAFPKDWSTTTGPISDHVSVSPMTSPVRARR